MLDKKTKNPLGFAACQRAEERFGLAICYPHLIARGKWP